jgi:hypothetical protein
MVVACVALLVALGGTSIAAVNALPHGSVHTAALANGAVTSSKIANKAVTLSKVALNARIPGPKGDPGTNGKNGTNGKDGTPGVSGLVVVTGSDVTLPANAGGTAHVSCPAGKTALAGGVDSNAAFGAVADSYPSPDRFGDTDQGWSVSVKAPPGGTEIFHAIVICANVAS